MPGFYYIIMTDVILKVTKAGHIVSETTFRLNMAKKEHTKHVRELLAQAIVHKTLDMERNRQVCIQCVYNVGRQLFV